MGDEGDLDVGSSGRDNHIGVSAKDAKRGKEEVS